jgi:hypothetical protein
VFVHSSVSITHHRRYPIVRIAVTVATARSCSSSTTSASPDGRPSVLGQAFAEYGRIAKTLHLLGSRCARAWRGCWS